MYCTGPARETVVNPSKITYLIVVSKKELSNSTTSRRILWASYGTTKYAKPHPTKWKRVLIKSTSPQLADCFLRWNLI
jgi:hypothetical protein